MTMVTDFEVMEEIHKFSTPKYFVAASGFAGSRHYSEDTNDYLKAVEIYSTYKDMLKYIGEGGYVILYGQHYGEYEIISEDWVAQKKVLYRTKNFCYNIFIRKGKRKEEDATSIKC